MNEIGENIIAQLTWKDDDIFLSENEPDMIL